MRESLGFLMKIITLLGLLMLLFFGSPATSAQSWMQIPITTNRWSSMACSADARKLFACAGGGQPFTAITPCLVYFSTNSGSTWLESGAPSNHWSSIASSADGNKVIAAVGSSSRSGGIYTSIDGGQNWASNNIPDRQWRSVTSSADGSKLYALTFNGELYSTSDSGMTWHSNSAPQRAWTIASSADGTKLIAAPGSSGGYLCTSSDSGATWLTNTSISPRVWWTVASSADGRVLAAVDGNGGPFGKVFTSTNYGVVWVTNALPALSWQYVALSADGEKIIAAAWYSSGVPAGPIYTSTNTGLTWISNAIPNLVWQGVTCSADGNKLLAISAGKTNTSTVGQGEIWVAHASQLPILQITLTNGAVLCWTVPSTSFNLQQTSNLMTPDWSDMTNAPTLNLVNLQNQVSLPITASNRFYRLKGY